MLDVVFVVLVSGEVIEVNCGVKCVIIEVVIFVDKEQQYCQFDVLDVYIVNCVDLVNFFKESGVWVLLCQCFYNMVFNLEVMFCDIFVSIFDIVLLVLDSNLIVAGQEVVFQ